MFSFTGGSYAAAVVSGDVYVYELQFFKNLLYTQIVHGVFAVFGSVRPSVSVRWVQKGTMRLYIVVLLTSCLDDFNPVFLMGAFVIIS